MDIKYIVFKYEYADRIDYNQVLETSIDTLRVSSLGDTFVKFSGETPPSLKFIPDKSPEYNYKQILMILSEPEWNNNNI
jgi:hypothetical protein